MGFLIAFLNIGALNRVGGNANSTPFFFRELVGFNHAFLDLGLTLGVVVEVIGRVGIHHILLCLQIHLVKITHMKTLNILVVLVRHRDLLLLPLILAILILICRFHCPLLLRICSSVRGRLHVSLIPVINLNLCIEPLS